LEGLIKDAFKHLNTFKRFRAMHDTATTKGDMRAAEELELKMYKSIDQLELSIRGIQRENREGEAE
jgi:hypothetical protein